MAFPRPFTWTLLACVALATPALAALPPLAPAELKRMATDIVVGEPTAITQEDKGTSDTIDTHYVATVKVQAVEKGTAAKAGGTIKVRYWRPKKRPSGWVGPQGQNVLAKQGVKTHFYLQQAKDGGLDALTPNGIVLIKPPK